jgi:hypothetical protein
MKKTPNNTPFAADCLKMRLFPSVLPEKVRCVLVKISKWNTKKNEFYEVISIQKHPGKHPFPPAYPLCSCARLLLLHLCYLSSPSLPVFPVFPNKHVDPNHELL